MRFLRLRVSYGGVSGLVTLACVAIWWRGLSGSRPGYWLLATAARKAFLEPGWHFAPVAVFTLAGSFGWDGVEIRC